VSILEDLQITDLLLGSKNESIGELKCLSNFVRDNVSNLRRNIPCASVYHEKFMHLQPVRV